MDGLSITTRGRQPPGGQTWRCLIGPGQNGKFRKRGRIPGPGRSGPAGPVIRRVENFRFFSNFFPWSPAGPLAFSDRIKHFFPTNIFFHHFFTLTRPEPPPKPSYVPKKHPQTLKKNMFLMIFFKKFEMLIKSSINLYLDLLGPGFDHLE